MTNMSGLPTVEAPSESSQSQQLSAIPLPSLPEPLPLHELNPSTSSPILTLQNDIAVRAYRLTDVDIIPQYCNNPKIWINMRDIWPKPYTLTDAQEWVSLNINSNSTAWQPVCSLRELMEYKSIEKHKSAHAHNNASSQSSSQPPNISNPPTNTVRKIPTNYVITHNDKLIGGIGLRFGSAANCKQHTAEFGYWLGEPYWGRGIATMVSKAFSEWAFNTFEYLVRIEAVVFAWNEASCGVLRKTGFVHEGRQRMGLYKDGKYPDLLLWGKVRQDMEEERAEAV